MKDVDRARARRGRLPHRLDQGGGRYPRRRHDHRGAQADIANRSRASSRCSRSCSAASFPSMRPTSRTCALRWGGCASTTPASPTRWRRPRRSASVSAAAFSGCCTSRSSRSGCDREFNLDLISTAPSVVYRLNLSNGSIRELHNPADMPDVMKIETIEEPWIRATILTPDEYLGAVLKLCQDRRGVQIDLNYVGKRAMVVYDLPLNEVVFDFYDRLKSISKGYASFDYHISDYREGDLVKMSILVNGEPVDALSMLVHRDTRREPRARHVREAQGPDPAASLPDPGPGGDRRQDHRPRDDSRPAQGRDRQVLRRRRDAASASSSTSRKRARSACASSARSRSRRRPSSPLSRWTARAASKPSQGQKSAAKRDHPRGLGPR